MKQLLLLILTIGLFTACEMPKPAPTADSLQQRQTEQSLSEANREIGMPAIVNFQERKIFKMILEERDRENLITYCYLVNEINGKVGQFLGKGIGYGVPASTQYTNPIKYRHHEEQHGGDYGIFLPQADPNGLFMPTSSSATWYMLLDEKGKPRPVYIEPLIIVSPIKLH